MQQQGNQWEIISASEFAVPGSPPKEAARGQSRRVWRWFQEEVLRRPEQVEAGGSTKSRDCSADELDTSSIDIDWNLAARVLFGRPEKTVGKQSNGRSSLARSGRSTGLRYPGYSRGCGAGAATYHSCRAAGQRTSWRRECSLGFSAIVGCVQQSDSGGSAFRAILFASRGGPGIGANLRRAVDVPPPRVARL